MLKYGCIIILAALVLAGGTARAQEKPTEAGGPAVKVADTYRLQPGDELTITVLPRMEYGGPAPISPDGYIYVKGVPPIKAAAPIASGAQGKSRQGKYCAPQWNAKRCIMF